MSILMITVILTTDAQPIPLSNTYVVPVRGNVTFTYSSKVEVSWSEQ